MLTDAERLRRDVLRLLTSWGSMTTQQLADDLEVWTQEARQALRVLEDAGAVERAGVQPTACDVDPARWAVVWRVV